MSQTLRQGDDEISEDLDVPAADKARGLPTPILLHATASVVATTPKELQGAPMELPPRSHTKQSGIGSARQALQFQQQPNARRFVPVLCMGHTAFASRTV